METRLKRIVKELWVAFVIFVHFSKICKIFSMPVDKHKKSPEGLCVSG
jgi:hypothetical protein